MSPKAPVAKPYDNNAGSFATDKMYLVAHTTDRYCAPGAMDDFRIYSRALTEEEIQGLSQ